MGSLAGTGLILCCVLREIEAFAHFRWPQNMSMCGSGPWGSTAHVLASRGPIGPAVQGLGGTNPAPHGHWAASFAEPVQAFCCVVPR
jgi:hypothetical protein